MPTNIAGDCSVDVTSALIDWIGSVPDGTPTTPNTVRLGANACYHVDYPFGFSNRHNLIFDGNGATIRRFTEGLLASTCCPKGYAHFQVGSSSNITVENLHVLGLNTVSGNPANTYDPAHFGTGFTLANEFESGYSFDTDTNLTLTNLTSDATFGDGVTLGGEHAGQADLNVVGTNIIIDRNGRQGFTLGTNHGVVLDDIQILHSQADGFDFEDNGDDSISNIEIRNSYVNSRAIAFAADGMYPVSNIYVHDNTVRSRSSWPWLSEGNNPSPMGRRHDWKVEYNTILSPQEAPTMAFTLTDNIDVSYNISPLSWSPNPYVQQYPGVIFTSAGGTITVIGNDFTGAGWVYASASSGPTSACGNRIVPGGPFDAPNTC